jgi:hypothetical protein
MAKKKSLSLRILQILWPILVAIVIIQSIAVCYFPESAALWISMLPTIMGLIGITATVAGGGPLVADQIKAKAGILGKEECNEKQP